jgi:hypothetical protein
MRMVLGLIAVGLLLLESGDGMPARTAAAASPANVSTVPAASSTKDRIDFDTQVKPIFKSNCMPCHFQGGQMYDKLPFDSPATIRKLGTRLFTRIKEENDRRLIEGFLSQTP